MPIEKFIAFLFAGAISRFRAFHAVYATAHRTLNIVFARANLSRREVEVSLCRFHGKSIAATAKLLNISEATVRRHIRMIRKRLTSAHSPVRYIRTPPVSPAGGPPTQLIQH